MLAASIFSFSYRCCCLFFSLGLSICVCAACCVCTRTHTIASCNLTPQTHWEYETNINMHMDIASFPSLVRSFSHRCIGFCMFVYSFSYAFIKICNISDGTMHSRRTLLSFVWSSCVLIAFVYSTRHHQHHIFCNRIRDSRFECICVTAYLISDISPQTRISRITVGYIHMSNHRRTQQQQQKNTTNSMLTREEGKMKINERKLWMCRIYFWLPVPCKADRKRKRENECARICSGKAWPRYDEVQRKNDRNKLLKNSGEIRNRPQQPRGTNAKKTNHFQQWRNIASTDISPHSEFSPFDLHCTNLGDTVPCRSVPVVRVYVCECK